MPDWIRKAHEPTVPLELMLPIRYLRFCPECMDFKPQETIVEGSDRILKCTVCGSSERFVLCTDDALFPEGLLSTMKSYVGKRVKEVIKK